MSATKILSKYLAVKKNISIFIKVLDRIDEGDEKNQIIYELCVDLKNKKSIKSCYLKLVNNEYMYGSPAFETVTLIQREQDDFITTPAEVEEGVLECHCGSKKTISFTLQTRSGDEATSVWARCVECGKKWQA
jgi:DNA-directed RNA polymerase subunit M/transcription elongation factor TFIIS